MGGLTVENPVPLSGALASPALLNGDTLNLLGWTYLGDYNYIGPQITITRYLAQRAIIDGSIAIGSDSTELKELEITCSSFTDREQESPSPSSRINSIVALTDLIIHDCNQGVYIPDEAGGGIIDGCIIFHNGYIGLDRGHGHGIYAQNAGDNPLVIKNCILFDGFGYNLHAYGEGVQKLDNIQFIDNISFKAMSLCAPTFDARPNLLLGGYGETNIVNKPVWHGNMTYGGAKNALGYQSAAIVNGLVEDNYLPEGITISDPDNVTLSGNVLAPEETNRVFVIPVRGRAHVAIYNWEGLDSVAVDVSGVFDVAATVTVTNVQDLFVDIVELVVSEAGTITIDMRAISHTVATPQGWTTPATTFPTFGCFVVEAA